MEQFLSRLVQYLVALPDIMEAALSSCGLTNTLPLQCLHHTNTKNTNIQVMEADLPCGHSNFKHITMSSRTETAEYI